MQTGFDLVCRPFERRRLRSAAAFTERALGVVGCSSRPPIFGERVMILESARGVMQLEKRLALSKHKHSSAIFEVDSPFAG
jgi:hypothetical protein